MKSNGITRTGSFLVDTEIMGFTFHVSQTMRARRKQVIPLCRETSTAVQHWNVGDGNACSLTYT
jgi:hypothetical protein